MITFDIYCDQYDFSSLAKAFEGEFAADCKTFAEIVFVDENEIRELNCKFRSVDKVTDVLSFPTLDNILGKKISAEDFPYDIDEDGALSLGSVAICKQVAKRQAEEYGHSYERELYYLATHGVCHLLGFDHINEADKPQMRQMEEKILEKLGLSRTE